MFRTILILAYYCGISILIDTIHTYGGVELERKQNRKYVLNDRLINVKKNFPLPKLSEEEENSMFVADHLTCPSCQAVVFQFHIAFSLAHKYNNKRLTDSEMLEITGVTQ